MATSNRRGPAPPSTADLTLVRRWLWEQYNVRVDRRPAAPDAAVRLWRGDPVVCAQQLRVRLIALLRDGKCSPADARAWASDASLHGRRLAKSRIAADLGITTRGLRKRLAAVDAALAETWMTAGAWPAVGRRDPVEQVVVALVDSMQAYADGRPDDGDGLYSAAADIAGLPRQHRGAPHGWDRTRRHRTKKTAMAGLPLRSLPTVLRAGGRASPSAGLLLTSSSLADEPELAVHQLAGAWQHRETDALPLLIDHAVSVAFQARDAGARTRLALLELVSGILRDMESLAALHWTSTWIHEAERAGDRRGVVNGRKTRAHVLQLHGFTSTAERDLDRAIHEFSLMDPAADDTALVGRDLALRRANLDVVVGNAEGVRARLPYAEPNGPLDRVDLSWLRSRHHAASMRATGDRRARGPAAQAIRRYDTTLHELLGAIDDAPPDARAAAWDTVLVAAARVRDTASVDHIAGALDNLAGVMPVNIAHRLTLHLLQAARTPAMSDLRDLRVHVPDDVLRPRELIPHDPAFLI